MAAAIFADIQLGNELEQSGGAHVKDRFGHRVISCFHRVSGHRQNISDS